VYKKITRTKAQCNLPVLVKGENKTAQTEEKPKNMVIIKNELG
jgi:hypothetical protein